MPIPKIAAAVAALLLCTGGARADPVAEFYKDQQVALVVGFSSGSGYDVYGRLVARYLSRHIPGRPTVAVQNMPGAGSLRAANYLYNDASNDGTVIGTFARDIPLLGVAGGNPQTRFDIRGFTWLGSSSSYANDAHLLFVHKDAPVRSIEDARRPGGPQLILGGTADGAAVYDLTNVARDALGLNVKVIATYPNRYAPYYAAIRGEVDGRFASLWATAQVQPRWLRPGGNMRVLMQFARSTRHKDFPDVPTAREVAEDDKARALIEFAELPYRLSRPFILPPGVPAERARALQWAFLAVHHDPQFLSDAARLRIEVSPIGAAEALAVVEAMAHAPAEVRQYIQNLARTAPGRGQGRGWYARQLSR
ncbi:MAG: Bug family tripartite tricarboxylate transporter substrate binding protein [Xanthobacteraceae bacterium]